MRSFGETFNPFSKPETCRKASASSNSTEKMSNETQELTLGGHLTGNRKLAWMCVTVLVAIILTYLYAWFFDRSLLVALEDGGSLSWLGSIMVGAMAGIPAGLVGLFHFPKKHPVFVTLKPNGLQAPNHPTYGWIHYETIEQTDKGLLFKSKEPSDIDIYAPIPKWTKRHKTAVKFLFDYAPSRLTERLRR